MSKTGGEIERDVFRLIRDSSVGTSIKGTVYRQDMRPANASTEDAVVSFLAGLSAQVQTGVVVVNIYVPDLTFPDGKQKDIDRCDQLEKLAKKAVKSFDTSEYDFYLDDTPRTYPVEGISQHFINLRIKFRRITV